MSFPVGILVLLVVITLALPLGAALGVAGIITLGFTIPQGSIEAILSKVVHGTIANPLMLTIPMFVLMSEFLACGGVARDLLLACHRMMGRVRGGLAMACILAGAIHAAATGSSSASAASLARASFPAMIQAGYARSLAVGTICSAGTLAIMIPPSTAFILYGLMTETSIGKLFLGGVIPGLMTAAAYLFTISLVLKVKPELGPKADETLSQAPQEKARGVAPMLILIVGIIAGLYSGLATPTEISALGAFGALLVSLWTRRMTWHGFHDAVGSTLRISTMIMAIIIGAHVFGYFISFSRITDGLLAWIDASGMSSTSVMLLIVFGYLVLGMFMDQAAIIILTAPISTSLMMGLGYDPVWWGIIIIKTAEIGMMTPPLGLVLFVTSATTKTDLATGFRGVTPFVVAELVMLAILMAFPQLTLWLGS
ncbi:TRAP transporter large permease [Paracoccus pantotrophus]|uniref:TRAP transporter large permease n=1 Tax=Paracoccus pantotrophus TaxID=82367 RepID=UPI00048A941E|nr:TRAP transporter large permease subunit [Paracoccus pantotrophus]